MIRTMDPARLNAVANDPDVRPMLGGEGPVDLTPTIEDAANIALEFEHGGFVFHRLELGQYELHTLFLPQGRGQSVLLAAAEAFRYLFTATDCMEIVTRAPGSNRPADFMARRAGFEPIFTREKAWQDGSAITYFSLTFDNWRGRDPEIAAEGRVFHQTLEAAKSAAGSAREIHPDDDAHDRAAGAAVMMLKAGQHRKAVWTYSRWARLAGYEPVELVNEAPAIVDIRDAVITVRNGGLEVLKCR
jgi:hypothetical protein